MINTLLKVLYKNCLTWFTCEILQGQQSEWALLKRHVSEDLFGVQVCGAHIDSMTRCAEVVSTHAEVDFIDINVGCPIDLVCNKVMQCPLLCLLCKTVTRISMERVLKTLLRKVLCRK